MTLYGQRSDGVLVTFEGMSTATVVAMLADQGLGITWLIQPDFELALKRLEAAV